jgi:hypothetical protein
MTHKNGRFITDRSYGMDNYARFIKLSLNALNRKPEN